MLAACDRNWSLAKCIYSTERKCLDKPLNVRMKANIHSRQAVKKSITALVCTQVPVKCTKVRLVWLGSFLSFPWISTWNVHHNWLISVYTIICVWFSSIIATFLGENWRTWRKTHTVASPQRQHRTPGSGSNLRPWSWKGTTPPTYTTVLSPPLVQMLDLISQNALQLDDMSSAVFCLYRQVRISALNSSIFYVFIFSNSTVQHVELWTCCYGVCTRKISCNAWLLIGIAMANLARANPTSWFSDWNAVKSRVM